MSRVRKIFAMFAIFAVLLLTASAAHCAARRSFALLVDTSSEKFDSADCVKGFNQARKEHGRKIKFEIFDAKGEESKKPKLTEKAAAYKTVIATGDYVKLAEKAAKKHPRTKFIVFTDAEPDNIIRVRFREQEIGFLAGCYMALMTSHPYSETSNPRIICAITDKNKTNDALELGFKAAATYINKDYKAVIERVDTTDKKELDEAVGRLKELGADIIFTPTGKEAAEAVHEAGIHIVDVNGEAKKYFPDFVSATVEKKSYNAIVALVDIYFNTTPPSKSISVGASSSSLGFFKPKKGEKDELPPEVRERMNDIEKKLSQHNLVIKSIKAENKNS